MLGRLRDAITRQMRATREKDYATFTDADRSFHQALYDAAGMSELFILMRQRSGHVDRLRRLHLPAKGKTQAVVRDHKAIVEALQSRQPDAAQAALRSHLAGTLTYVDEVRLKHPQWVSG